MGIMLCEKPLIINIETLFLSKLFIPNYQRPYTWSKNSAILLFNDTFNARGTFSEYRLGNIILHKENDQYNIVDGQQRVITIKIILNLITKITGGNLNLNIKMDDDFDYAQSPQSDENKQYLNDIISRYDKDVLNKYKDYLLKNCTFLRITTDDIDEAFQFFDCQNARGLPLDPQDLLKAYHLRKMPQNNNTTKIIKEWEAIPSGELKYFFSENLFPLVEYYKGNRALNYNVKSIDVFKGVDTTDDYNYCKYFNKTRNSFLLTQSVIAGKQFFYYISHYYNIKKSVVKIIDSKFSDILPLTGSGDIYTKELFINCAIFFYDRFSAEALKENIVILLRYAYSVRLVMSRVTKKVVACYALGKNDWINKGINIFYEIANARNPAVLRTIKFQKITSDDIDERYKDDKHNIYSKLIKILCSH